MAEAGNRRGPAGRDLTQGPIGRTLVLFALPVLGANVLQSMNGSINAIWVGRFLGEEGLAATSNANLIMFLLLGTMFGLTMAANILVAQAMGAHDEARARRIVGSSAAFFFVLSTSMAVAGFLLTPQILGALGTPENAAAMAQEYLRVIFVAIPFMNLSAFLMAVLRGSGDSQTPFRFMALSVVIDLILNPPLITGWGPFPQLGAAGASTATLIAQGVTLTALLTILYRRKHPLRLAGPDLRLLRPDPALVRTLFSKGAPMGLQMIVVSSSGLVVMGLVNGYGSQTAAAYGVAAQLWSYVQMPALALGAAVSSMAAQNVGAGRWDRVERIARAGVIFNTLMTSALVLVLYLVDRAVFRLFLPMDPAAVEIAVHVNRMVAWSFVLFGVMLVLFATVRATGDVWPPLIILFVSIVLVRLPLAWALQGPLGADGVWWSFPVGFGLSMVLAVAYYRMGRWRKASMARPRPAGGEAPDGGFGMPRERAGSPAE